MKRLVLDDMVVVAGLGVVGGIVGALAGGEGRQVMSVAKDFAVGAGIAAGSYVAAVTAGQYAASALSYAVKYVAGKR